MKKFILAFLIFCFSTPAFAAASKESTFDRIIRTGEIRCGYLVWPPFVNKDPNTGAYSGFIYDYIAALAKAMDLKLVMAQEFSLATYLQDMNNGRFDIECGGGWSNSKRGKLAEYTQPIAYFPVVAVVRAKETRAADMKWINNPGVKVVVLDGETSSFIRSNLFPASQPVELEGTQASDILVQISTGKADVAFADVPAILAFQKNNPGTIKILSRKPVRVMAMNISLPANDFRLQNALNTATQELLNDGVIDRILDKYDPDHTMILRLAKPYVQ